MTYRNPHHWNYGVPFPPGDMSYESKLLILNHNAHHLPDNFTSEPTLMNFSRIQFKVLENKLIAIDLFRLAVEETQTLPQGCQKRSDMPEREKQSTVKYVHESVLHPNPRRRNLPRHQELPEVCKETDTCVLQKQETKSPGKTRKRMKEKKERRS